MNQQRDDERYHRQPEHVVPAERLRQRRREQRREHGAGIARPSDAERRALVLRWIPARGERQRDRERCPGHAKEHAEDQYLLVARDATQLRAAKSRQYYYLPDQPRLLGFEMVEEDAGDNA